MTSPLVSIVIPCYNASAFVRDAIHSALTQTYSRREIVVVDDGSTDDSLGVIASFGGAVRCATGPNRGACAARNLGMSIAKGEFIQFLDADDELHPQKLEYQVPHAIKRGSSITYTKWTSELADDGAGHLFCRHAVHDDSVVIALTSFVQTAAPLYPRSWLDAVGGWDECRPCGQDFDLNLRLACAGAEFVQLPEPLAILRRRSGSLSSNLQRVLDECGDSCFASLERLHEAGGLTEERAAAFAAYFAGQARQYLRLGLIEKAMQRFRRAQEIHRSGGLVAVYTPLTLLLRAVIGPVKTEYFVQVKRTLMGRRASRHT